jgi:hypothetical protein
LYVKVNARAASRQLDDAKYSRLLLRNGAEPAASSSALNITLNTWPLDFKIPVSKEPTRDNRLS